MIIAAVPCHRTGLTHDDPRRVLLNTLQAHDFTGEVAVTADSDKDAGMLNESGADLLLMPFRAASDQAADLLLDINRRSAEPEQLAVAKDSKRNGVVS